ncbi:phosphatase [Clostridium cellulovorans]|uniref:PHP domain protein n=1 Tax=Clostridium cellulovorans (strain ATCC 35296 / DSM 3052 / OCM 3 / 743B) TaxID=573061 RepID=D9SKC4_CLOC7|nr:PHP domain-containing protein [Clostridium cellulovorans]ADL51420.1 PHP domain protein [Clostridium cellulovorans 743B]
MIKGDFHIHSTASDGTLSPTEIVTLAKNNGVDVIALTDHDNTKGVEEAILAGLTHNIKVIPGVELSTLFNNETIHILGFFKDDQYKNPKLQAFFDSIENSRISRAEKIISNLKKHFDVSIEYEKAAKKANGVIARPHLAKTIIDAGYPYTYDEIFDTMLSNNSPAYIPAIELSTDEGIKILKSFGAKVILAHPVLIRKNSIEELIKLNFDGIEARYIQNNSEATKKLLKIAKKNNLLVTAGSDFHTEDPIDTRHGTIGSCPLSDTELQIFLDSLE